jgi:hypothetical protein
MYISATTTEISVEVPPKTELPYEPTISFLVLYPKESKSAYNRDNLYTHFTVVQFTITKLWNQPRCLPTEE